MMGKVFAAIFRKAMRDRPLQFVSVADIGHFAALAFTNSDKYNGAAISLAGDEIAFRQLQGVFRERTGGSLPESMGIMATLTLMVVNEVSVMMKWFHDEGYRADIPRLREQHPGLMTFGDYFVQKSGFPMQK